MRPERRDEEPEDLLWQQIVDNYGDRPDWEPPQEPARPTGAPGAGVADAPEARQDEPIGDAAEEYASDLQRGPDERFRPPPPPPLPQVEPLRLLAWIGLFGVPTLVLLGLLVGLRPPSWLGLLLMLWFVGGFGFLVASMRPRPEDPDQGAVV